MKENPLKVLETFGQSIWLDYINRNMFESGELKRLISEDGLKGMTSNPTIFEKSITEGHSYDAEIKTLAEQKLSVEKIFQQLAIHDVQTAADEFRNLYDSVEQRDGFVSLEVNPHYAHDTEATIKEARELWSSLNRPNVMIKVPATLEGLPAITQLISDGINVNVTLLFSVERYQAVTNAYIEGLEKRLAKGAAINNIASVASFFLSRIDSLLDPELEKLAHAGEEAVSVTAKFLQGQIAIASAKEAYAYYQTIFNSDRFNALKAKGARTQRLLWASTSTKNPNYPDVKYVEALIGPDTVNTLPMETLEDYRDHGRPKDTLTNDTNEAKESFSRLATLNIDIHQATQQLEDEGVEKFVKSYDQLIQGLKNKLTKKGMGVSNEV